MFTDIANLINIVKTKDFLNALSRGAFSDNILTIIVLIGVVIVTIYYGYSETLPWFKQIHKNVRSKGLSRYYYANPVASFIFQVALIAFCFGVLFRIDAFAGIGILTIIWIAYIKILLMALLMIVTGFFQRGYGPPAPKLASKIGGYILLIIIAPVTLLVTYSYLVLMWQILFGS
jgi:hypothetical protein